MLDASAPTAQPAARRPAVQAAPARHTVGREAERGELRAAFESARSGRGLLLCIAGEPGIGKTTLVEDFLAELAAEGQATITRGSCSERLAGTEAYLPHLEALEGLLRSQGPDVARAMRELAPTWYAQVAVTDSGSGSPPARGGSACRSECSASYTDSCRR
jgi:MoxR-like ATPase